MAGRYKPKINHNSEFELDLAPLLAVMVKLVPVLLLSSAFVQMMIIETELPQVVQEAITQQATLPKPATISLNLDNKTGISIVVTENGQEKIKQIDLDEQHTFDFEKLHQIAQEIKKLHPEIFKIELNPSANVQYKDIIKIMDEVRKSKSAQIRFPVKDEKSGNMTSTDYMFPEVVFTNMLEG